jgi:acyl-coenzyme A synthetase/AMP-(fatty) acid ligase
VEGLGSTEALHIYLSNTHEHRRSGAAGMRVTGYEVALKDLDGNEVADEEQGVLWVRGDSNAPLYWNRADKTADTMRADGWIYTGDRMRRDCDGFYYFLGRADKTKYGRVSSNYAAAAYDLIRISRPQLRRLAATSPRWTPCETL